MTREIMIKDPEGDLEDDGEEEDDPGFREMIEEWRFELGTYNY